MVERTFLLNKALGEGLTAAEMARLDASMEAANRDLADRIDSNTSAVLDALSTQRMGETRASIDARGAAAVDAAARTAQMHAGVTASNAQRDAIIQARKLNADNATNAAIARGMAMMASGNGHASGVDFGSMRFTPVGTFDFSAGIDDALASAQDWLRGRVTAIDAAGQNFADEGNYVMAGATAFLKGGTRIASDVFGGTIGMARLFTDDAHMEAFISAVSSPRDTVSHGIEAFADMSPADRLLAITEFVGFGGGELLATAGRATLNVARGSADFAATAGRGLLDSIGTGPLPGSAAAQIGALNPAAVRLRVATALADDSVRARVLSNVAQSRAARLQSRIDVSYVGNFNRAMDFYSSTGWAPSVVLDHVRGINLSLPVEVMHLPPKTTVVQYQYPGSGVGNYFSPPGTPANTLGMPHLARTPVPYVTQSGATVLRSTAADMLDWNGSGVVNPGGGIQYFTYEPHLFDRII